MPYSAEGKLVVAIFSRGLFDFEEENRVFDALGERAGHVPFGIANIDRRAS
jgi:hypothetical protein